MAKMTKPGSFIKGWVLVLATLNVAACAESPTFERPVSWGGKEGAECMARVLRTIIPERDPRVSAFQDFDVVYTILEYTFFGKRDHLIVVSAADWEEKRVIQPIDSRPRRVLAGHRRYYFQRGEPRPRLPTLTESGAITAAVIAEWDRSCDAGEMWLLGGNPDPRAPVPVPIFKVTNQELFDAFAAALEANKVGKHTEAIAKAREADAIEGKPPQLAYNLHLIIVRSAIAAKDYPTALAEVDKIIAAGEGDPQLNLKLRQQILSESAAR